MRPPARIFDKTLTAMWMKAVKIYNWICNEIITFAITLVKNSYSMYLIFVNGMIVNRVWISNCIHNFMWDTIIHGCFILNR